jgi:hypothetical protein
MDIGASGTDHGFPAVARDPGPALTGWAWLLSARFARTDVEHPRRMGQKQDGRYTFCHIAPIFAQYFANLSLPRDVKFTQLS